MKYKQITAADRGAIEILLKKDYTASNIAKILGRHKSTICREINQRSTPSGYFAQEAHLDYESKRVKCKPKRKLSNTNINNYIFDKLQRGYSPEQISGRLKYEQHEYYVCHETIYSFIYSDSYCIEEKFFQYLRYGYKKRKKHNGRSVHHSKIPNRVSIHDRPIVVDQRVEIGHWEGDSVIYPNKKAINTLNELKSGFVVFTKLNRKTSEDTVNAIINGFNENISKTLTVDNGTEFMLHERITEHTGVNVYFADPYSSWQRGSNENTNMLLRGYLPKKRNIDKLTQDELDDIAWELNNRPRKRLGYRTPMEVYTEEVYSLINS